MMCDGPQAFNSVTRKARKHHKCCECREIINVGDQYQYSSGVWDGQGASFKQCLDCLQIMEGASLMPDYDPPAFEDLREWFFGFMCIGFEGEDFLQQMAEDVGVSPENLDRLLGIRKQGTAGEDT